MSYLQHSLQHWVSGHTHTPTPWRLPVVGGPTSTCYAAEACLVHTTSAFGLWRKRSAGHLLVLEYLLPTAAATAGCSRSQSFPLGSQTRDSWVQLKRRLRSSRSFGVLLIGMWQSAQGHKHTVSLFTNTFHNHSAASSLCTDACHHLSFINTYNIAASACAVSGWSMQ